MKKTSLDTAIRTVELNQPLPSLTDLQEYSAVRIFITLNGQLLGSVDIANRYQTLTVSRLRNAIVDTLILKLLETGAVRDSEIVCTNALAMLNKHFIQDKDKPLKLPDQVSASIVVATLDRPDELRKCICSLLTQETSRQIEIVVVDNNPDSGLIKPVVAEFSQVVLVNEPRRGLAYARNAGFIASKGDVCIATDDDVRFPPDWLEKLLAPFYRNEVMAVTGNVLPCELGSQAQNMFEEYGGLGRGYKRLEANEEWFERYRFKAVPTWEIGATANAAFRASIFNQPDIGLMNEALGPGMPSGVGEDTYLFYKILKAGYTIIYEPTAYVWHRHRPEMESLRNQLYNYSKGHVAYHLTTLIRDHDFRALVRLALELPIVHLWRIMESLRGRSSYPVSLILLEIIGNLAGPLALWKSLQRVKRESRSDLKQIRRCKLIEKDHV